jgi:hypothetical protein
MPGTEARRRYTIPEVARLLNYHPDTVRYWLRVGELVGQPDQESGDWLVRDEELVTFLRGNGEAVPDTFSRR